MHIIERAITWAAVGLGSWFCYKLFLRNGRLLLRIEELEAELAELQDDAEDDDNTPYGLPEGTLMLDFALPTLSGEMMNLSQWRGQRVMLIFFDPNCGFCQQMLPDLARLEPNPTDGRPVPLIISTGDAEKHRRLMEEHGIRCTVLLQERDEVAQVYKVPGTPMGYLLDENGVTVSPLVAGVQAVLALAGVTAPAPIESHNALQQGRQHTLRTLDGSTAASRINRDGLKAGTPAPPFNLPLVTGGELSLESLFGRDVLLVFSDPLCGPCNELAPKLEQIHRRMPDLQVLMLSRGDLEDNRAKIAEHNLTFPMVLQRHWEISRDYAMFATPIGYLIDARGIIAEDVAVGSDAILALASAEAHRSNGHREAFIR